MILFVEEQRQRSLLDAIAGTVMHQWEELFFY